MNDAIKSKKNVLEKRLRIDIAMLREMFEQKIITNIHNINTKTQLANALAKKGASIKELLDLLLNDVINMWNKLYCICSLLDEIDFMRSIEQPIVHYLNLLCLINKLLNLIVFSGWRRIAAQYIWIALWKY